MFDCLIIGAGATAAGATARFMRSETSTLCLEAMSIPGGRTRTASLAGLPFDEGASFIHASESNPWTAIAADHGFATSRDLRLRVDAGHGPARSDPSIIATRLAGFAHLDDHRERVGDSDAASLLEAIDGRWAHAARMAVGPWLTGDDNHRLSIADFCGSASGEDLFVAKGYGTLVSHLLSGGPIRLNHRVSEIREHAGHVSVSGAFGSLEARGVIITVSTEHLRRGTLRITPGLSPEHRDALDVLPLSALTKIGLCFSEELAGLTDTAQYLQLDHDDPTLPLYLSRPGDLPYLLCFTGGDHGRWLQRQSLATVVASALAPLERALKRDLRGLVRAARITRWDHDPTSFGSYSYGKPGLGDARQALAKPLGQRIFLAGEATAQDGWWATAAGAYMSGERAAREVETLLGA